MFFQLEVQSRERVQQLTRPNCVERDAVKKPFNKTVPGSETKPKTMSAPSATALHPACPMVPRICVFCDSATHKSERCLDYSAACKEKKGQVFLCLGTRQIAKFCRTKGVTCPLCTCHHHQSVCEQSEVNPVLQLPVDKRPRDIEPPSSALPIL